MMNDGESAFPVPPDTEHCEMRLEDRGMSLRDWFAGMVLQGFCVEPGGDNNAIWEHGEIDACAARCLAQEAYRLADAMLAERSKQK